ncbi:MAG TPA: hypothetical protein VEI99_00870 [Terriglobales bacterium]|nr:hypothetical protein [Terriglobales bacterium]
MFPTPSEIERRGGVMELMLTSDERELLLEVLEEHHRQLIREIARARHHEFKSALKSKERMIESVVNKLKGAHPVELSGRAA